MYKHYYEHVTVDSIVNAPQLPQLCDELSRWFFYARRYVWPIEYIMGSYIDNLRKQFCVDMYIRHNGQKHVPWLHFSDKM